jgi:monofunctional biosynthetic peptidoglycan transglycosylase
MLTILSIPALFLLWELLTLPFFSVYGLKSTNPTETALMLQRVEEAEEKGLKLKISNRWISIGRIPRHTLDAIVAAEDGTFYSHSGFDWFEVQESLSKNLEEGRAARGASTITQQLAKNLYLSTSKTFLRKFEEFIITLLMEWQLSKTRILELYVNLIEWGPGVFGIETAARTYFGKSASELSLDESLRLAAVIPSPVRHRPNSDGLYVTRRAVIIHTRMLARGDVRMKTEPEGIEPEEIELEELEAIPDTISMMDTIRLEPLDTGKTIDQTDFPDSGRARDSID